jgi:hypothetical protein
MRKLLTLLLVLSMASAASATLQISVDGNPDPVDSQYTLGPSEELILDIWTDSMIYGGQPGEGDWLLYCDTNLATISGGVGNPAIIAGGNTLAIYDGKVTGGWSPEPPDPMDGVGGAVFVFGAPIMPNDILYDQIVFHCEGGEGDVLVQLVSGVVVGTEIHITGVYDELVIHQTPEPMTLGLLGLGGLGLIRRRK